MTGRADGFARQWEIALVLSRGRASIHALAARFGVTERTILRDLYVLERVFPLYRDLDGHRAMWSMLSEGGRAVRTLALRASSHPRRTHPVVEAGRWAS